MNRLRRNYLHASFVAGNWTAIAGMALRNGLFKTLAKDMPRYPWMKTLLRANLLLNKFGKDRDDAYFEATRLVTRYVIRGFVELLEDMFQRGDRLIIHEDMVPPEIFRAMNLTPFMAELLGISLPIIDPYSVEEYIDRSENAGVPPDICSLPKSIMGFALADQFPPALALVASNLPCDGGMASYTVMERKLNLPTVRIDIPHHFYNDRARTYFVNELRRMITWLEANTPGKMDWDKLAAICTERNRMVEHELELWEMLQTRPAPDIAAGIFASIAKRGFTLLKRVGITPEVTLTGGCAKSRGLIVHLEWLLRTELAPLSIDPQLMGALGAAAEASKSVARTRATARA